MGNVGPVGILQVSTSLTGRIWSSETNGWSNIILGLLGLRHHELGSITSLSGPHPSQAQSGSFWEGEGVTAKGRLDRQSQ